MYTPNHQIDFLFDKIANTRNKVAIWRQSLDTLGKEDIFAIQVNAQAVNLAEEYLEHLPASARFISLDANRLVETIDRVASAKGSIRVLAYNLDQLLWRLTDEERAKFWQTVLEGLTHRERSLILLVPTDAVLPQGIDEQNWTAVGRLL